MILAVPTPQIVDDFHVISHDLTNQKWSLNGSYTFSASKKQHKWIQMGGTKQLESRRDVS
jgi:hypothetical protein